MRRLTRPALLVWMLWALVGWGLASPAEDRAVVERKIKAAYLYNFAKFVIWPPEVLGTNSALKFTIGVLGDKALAQDLGSAVADKMIGEHHIDARLLTSSDDLRACHILFIGTSEQGRLDQILDQVKGASVLTVSDAERFLDKGGIIQLYQRDTKIRFEISSEASARANLKISAKLRQLSKAP